MLTFWKIWLLPCSMKMTGQKGLSAETKSRVFGLGVPGPVLDSSIAGAHGAGGEIGHITVNPHETAVCGCGKHGCLEQYSSATGVVRL